MVISISDAPNRSVLSLIDKKEMLSMKDNISLDNDLVAAHFHV